MFAQISHMAMISHQYPMLGRFYEATFGLNDEGLKLARTLGVEQSRCPVE